MNMKFTRNCASESGAARQPTPIRRRALSRLTGVFLFGLVAMEAGATQPPDPTNSDGNGNTAGGTGALHALSSGSNNTAFGFRTLYNNSTGAGNTAVGEQALYTVTSGNSNSAFGQSALGLLTTGGSNSAFGSFALQSDTLGNYNTAVGVNSLENNTGGSQNTATGFYALFDNNGGSNTANGVSALEFNTSGSQNSAFGVGALTNNSSGNSNIGVGYNAGENLTTGSNNIDIGNLGVAAETGIIRIGTAGTQTGAYIAGVSGVTVTGGADVVINSSGQLGTVVSSAQYKKDIQDMGDDSARLALLRPVTFHYKADPEQQKQYGLIAEEVAKVYPDLAVRDAEGKVQSVQYHQLIPMLLNELQRQQRELAALKTENAGLVTALRNQQAQTEARLTRLEQQGGHPATVASR